MSLGLRLLLIIVSMFNVYFVSKKLRKSQVQITDTVFWLGLSVVFVLLAIFPKIASFFSLLFGFEAPVNFIFLVVIFLLLIRCFLLNTRLSFLDERVRNLTEEIALRENENMNCGGDNE